MRFVVALLALAIAGVAATRATPAVDPVKAEPVIARCISIYHEAVDSGRREAGWAVRDPGT